MARPFTEQIEPMLIGSDVVVHDAVRAIDRSGHGFAMVVDAERRLIATVTDGDIRRAMLAGVDFEGPIGTLLAFKTMVARPRPATAPVETRDDEILKIMQTEQVNHLPLLDADNRVVDVAFLGKLIDEVQLDITAVVMAGGYGRRLHPFTDATPKPMLPVGDRPLLERTIEQLRSAGITEVNITTHYLHDQSAEYFGGGDAFGVSVNYVRETEPLGTAGALGLMEQPQSTILVLNGDVLTNVDFRAMADFHRSHAAEMTVAAGLHEVTIPYGVVDTNDGRVTEIREKPKVQFSRERRHLSRRAACLSLHPARQTARHAATRQHAHQGGAARHQLSASRVLARYRARDRLRTRGGRHSRGRLDR